MATKDIKLLGTIDGIFYANFSDICMENYQVILIDGEQKIIQQIIKFILTERGTLPLFPNYGTSITKSLNQKALEVSLEDIKNEIVYGVKYIQEQNVNDDINIKDIKDLQLKIINQQELNVRMSISLTNGSVLTLNENMNLK